MTRKAAVLFAVLLVGSVVAPFATPVLGQTGTELTVGGNYPQAVTMDTSDLSGGTYTVEVVVDDGEIPGHSSDDGETVLVRRTLSTSDDRDNLVFYNVGAYSELTFRYTLDTATGNATAHTGEGDGSLLDTVTPLGHTGGDADLACGTHGSLANFAGANVVDCNLPVQERTGTPASNISEVDGYAHGVTVADTFETWKTTQQNFQNASYGEALAQGNVIVHNYIANGSTASAAKTYANETINDYYSARQANMVKDWNRRVESAIYLENSSVATRWDRDGTNTYSISETRDHTVTLLNGSTMVLKELRRYDSGSDNYYHGAPNIVGYSGDSYKWEAEVQDPDSGSWTPMFSATYYETLDARISADAQRAKDNIAQVADTAFAQYQAGELNATDFANLSPLTIATQAYTEQTSTGYNSFGATMLAAMGQSGDLNASHAVTTENNITYNGTLFYTADDVTNLSTGSTIDPTTGNGSYYIAWQDGNQSGLTRLDTNFTIDEATNVQTGESLNETTITRKYMVEADGSQLAEEVDKLRDLRQRYEDQLTEFGGSGDSGSGLNLSTEQMAVGAAGLAVAALLASGRDGGGNNN